MTKTLIHAPASAPVGNPLPGLKAARLTRGMTRRDLMETSGYSHTHIVKLEQGIANASATCAQVLADSIGVDVSVIL